MLPDRTHLVQKACAAPEDTEGLRVWQPKLDGCNLLVVVQNGAHCFSRTGKNVLSCTHLSKELEQVAQNGVVYFGEVWHPQLGYPDISGRYRSHAPDAGLEYHIFDAVPYADFVSGESALTYLDRRQLFPIPSGRIRVVENYASSSEAGSFNGGAGLDGLISWDPCSNWIAGVRGDGACYKHKPHLTLDLRVVGYTLGKGKFSGKLGAFLCSYKGKTIRVGGGKLTAEMRDNPDYWLGKIIEVKALGETTSGHLREPIFLWERHDKTIADYEE